MSEKLLYKDGGGVPSFITFDINKKKLYKAKLALC